MQKEPFKIKLLDTDRLEEEEENIPLDLLERDEEADLEEYLVEDSPRPSPL